jgi:dihydrofolate reductase
VAKLIYSAITSLDGYVADETGGFDWAAPDDEVHAAVNDLERGIGTYLYGRRMYDVMAAWETMPTGADQSAVTRDFADVWRAADKVVYSTTLDAATTARTRVERSFDPAAVRALVATAPRDLSVGGPGLAGLALAAGLVDDLHQFVTPVVVGGGTGWLPEGVRVALELASVRRFASGVLHVHYRTRS